MSGYLIQQYNLHHDAVNFWKIPQTVSTKFALAEIEMIITASNHEMRKRFQIG